MHIENLTRNQNQQISPNRYQLLEPISENTELVSKDIQNTDALRLSGKENELKRNRNVLASQNTGNKRPSVVINKYLLKANRLFAASRRPWHQII